MGRKRYESAVDYPEIAQGDEATANLPHVWGGYIIRPSDAKYTDTRQAPHDSGIYAWYTKDAELMYVGRSNSIRKRLVQHEKTTNFLGGNPTYFSFRLVPERWVFGVESAHIRVLQPIENMALEGRTLPFAEDFAAAIEAAWRGVLPGQVESLNRKYTALAEQIAARL